MLNICGNHILARENSTRRPSHKFLPAVTHRITFMLWLSFSLAQSRDNTILFPSLFSTIRPLMINIHRFPDSFLTRAFQSYILFLDVVLYRWNAKLMEINIPRRRLQNLAVSKYGL